MKKSTVSSTRNETFLDTSGFYALLVKGDSKHARAVECIEHAKATKGRFVTSDYVLDETATLLRARGLGHLTSALFGIVFASAVCQVEWMDPERFAQVQ